MKRLGIITLYDPLNQIDISIQKMINDLRQYLKCLIVVCNFTPLSEGMKYLQKHADYILIRDNIGYDGGAIKDAITYLTSDTSCISLLDYDELVILNDTFYGLLKPLNSFFDWFYNSDVSFAGLTKNDGGYFWKGISVPSHIQGYFIAIKRMMFISEAFIDYWNNFNYCLTSDDNIYNFEYGFSEYFSDLGYKYDGFYNLRKIGLSQIGDVDYLDHPYELIKYSNYPIFKYKAAWIDHLNDSSYKALKLIKSLSLNDFNAIMQHVVKSSNRMYIMQDALSSFCKEKTGLYIYGDGVWGQRIFRYLDLNDYRFKGFIVSKVSDDGSKRNVICISDLKLGNSEGIIVGMNRQNTLEVKSYLEQELDIKKVFFPNLT